MTPLSPLKKTSNRYMQEHIELYKIQSYEKQKSSLGYSR